jgi:predicted DNA-binding protein (MmcQ/YjbR family)
MAAMTPEELRDYCLAKRGAWPDSPWEDHTVAKVSDKIFAFLGDEGVGLKLGADRAEADEWIREFPHDASVMAYIGRSGWNDLRINGAIPDEVVLEAVDTSYDLVVAKLPRSRRPPSDR